MIRQKNGTPSPDTRGALLTAIAELASLSPDWRLGQLVCNVADYAGDAESPPPAVWDATDEQLLAAAQELIRHRRVAGETSIDSPSTEPATKLGAAIA